MLNLQLTKFFNICKYVISYNNTTQTIIEIRKTLYFSRFLLLFSALLDKIETTLEIESFRTLSKVVQC